MTLFKDFRPASEWFRTFLHIAEELLRLLVSGLRNQKSNWLKMLGAGVGKRISVNASSASDVILFHFQTTVPEPCKKWSRVSDKFELICPYSDWSPSSRQVQFENSSFWSRLAARFRHARQLLAPPPGTKCWRRPQFGLYQFVKKLSILFLQNEGLMELSSGKGFQLF